MTRPVRGLDPVPGLASLSLSWRTGRGAARGLSLSSACWTARGAARGATRGAAGVAAAGAVAVGTPGGFPLAWGTLGSWGWRARARQPSTRPRWGFGAAFKYA